MSLFFFFLAVCSQDGESPEATALPSTSSLSNDVSGGTQQLQSAVNQGHTSSAIVPTATFSASTVASTIVPNSSSSTTTVSATASNTALSYSIKPVNADAGGELDLNRSNSNISVDPGKGIDRNSIASSSNFFAFAFHGLIILLTSGIILL